MDDPLVTIAEFRSAMEAGLAKARLEASGIRAFLSNEHSGMSPGSSVGLRVSESDAMEAVALLRGAEPARDSPPEPADWRENEEVERCPVCEGSLVSVHEPSWPLQLLRILLSLFLPLPERVFASNRRSCGICGYRWRAGEFSVTQVPPTKP